MGSCSDKNIQLLDLVKLSLPGESNTNLRRLIEQGGVQLNDEKHMNPREDVTISDGDVLKSGKRKYFKIKIN